jgi:type III secretion protein R
VSALAPLAPLLPFALVLAASFLKIAVVLSILRRGLGGSAVPPASVATALALILAIFVTAPVGEKAMADPKGAVPSVRAFFVERTPARERQSFFEMQQRLRPEAERAQVRDDDLVVLAPAFAAAELKAAFQMGFLLLLPFLVIELLVSTVLASLGMTALNPSAVALPFKLLLFVLVDGWHLLMRSLVAT